MFCPTRSGHACLEITRRCIRWPVTTHSHGNSPSGQRSMGMARIPIHNETDYTLTEDMTTQLIRDAQEHFGEEVRAMRVQSGIERHALNARTREVRYAFSPQDFGFGHTMPTVHEPFDPAAARSDMDEEPEGAIFPASFEDVEEDEEET